MGEFGDKFRKVREKKELSLDDVSNVTKIGARMLLAIEEEHFDRLPGGVFNKGFIRAYAKHLGLNDEDAVNDYLACLRQAQIDAREVWEPQARDSARSSRSAKPGKVEPKKSQLNATAAKAQPGAPVEELPELQLPRAEHVRPRREDFADDSAPGIPWGIVGVAAVVVILAVVLWTRRSHGPNTAVASTPQSKPTSAKLELAKLEPAQPESAVAAPIKTAPAGAVSTVPKSTAKTSTSSAAVSARAPAPGSQTPASTTGSTGASATPPSNAQDQDKSKVGDPPKTSPQSPAKATAPLTLVIRATETSWISILADGQPVGHETLIAPARTSVRAAREIVARVGNAAGVTFVWNGQEVPADGAEAEVKTFVFDSTGMRVVPSTPPAAQTR